MKKIDMSKIITPEEVYQAARNRFFKTSRWQNKSFWHVDDISFSYVTSPATCIKRTSGSLLA